MQAVDHLEQANTRPIAHFGSCGERRSCWREACREQWRDMKTIEIMRNGRLLSHCHGQTYTATTDFAMRVERWRYPESETWA